MERPLLHTGLEHPAAAGFLRAILRSGLLTRGQLQEALRPVPSDLRGEPELLADHLVKCGMLSRFQARKLLQGVAGGLVLGPYQVLAPIGKGGMSTVYLARDSRNQKLSALKVLPPKRAREEDRLLARFRREMEMCRRVSHPHLALSHEVGVCQGVYYIAMEFIPGQNLYRVVHDQGPLTVPRAARLIAEVASGLEHAHQQGLIHRDLKPSNIMVTPNDHAKVLDLGLALMQGETPADRTVVGGHGYVVGTMDYLAPEQAEDATKVDPRSDLYGLGCTVYFALTGQPPFPGGNALQKILRHCKEEPRPVSDLNPTVPAAFAALVRKMMAKHPDRRPASAAEVQQQLLPWASAEPALPLDQAGDKGYEKAMAAIEAEGIWAELTADSVPVPAWSAPRPWRLQPVLREWLQSIKKPDRSFWPAWSLSLAAMGLGLVILLAFILGLRFWLTH